MIMDKKGSIEYKPRKVSNTQSEQSELGSRSTSKAVTVIHVPLVWNRSPKEHSL